MKEPKERKFEKAVQSQQEHVQCTYTHTNGGRDEETMGVFSELRGDERGEERSGYSGRIKTLLRMAVLSLTMCRFEPRNEAAKTREWSGVHDRASELTAKRQESRRKNRGRQKGELCVPEFLSPDSSPRLPSLPLSSHRPPMPPTRSLCYTD